MSVPRSRTRVASGVVLLLAVMAVFGSLTTAAQAAPGDLDTSFGADGIAYIDLGAATTVLRSAVQADASVILICGDSGMAYLMRLTPEGQVDTSFGNEGRTLLDWTDAAAFRSWTWGRIWLQPMNGRIIIEGRAYTVTGLPDASYGGSGHPTSGEVGAMTADGGFVWVGGSTVTRLTADGALDASFGTDGSRALPILEGWPTSAGDAVMVDKQGRIFLKGGVGPSFGTMCVLRLLPNGDLDTTFTGDGFEISHWWTGVHFLMQGPGDWIYALWSPAVGTVDEFEPNRIASSGATATPQVLFGATNVNSWTFMPDGSWVLGGTFDSGFPKYRDILLRRFTPLGLPDETFASGGRILLDLGGWDDSASIIVRPDGRILVAGVTQQTAAALPASRAAAEDGSRSTTTGQVGMVAQLVGGHRTGLAVRLTRAPTTSLVTLRLRSGRASWRTTATLKCNRTPVGAVKLTLMRSRDGRTWSRYGTATTKVTGSAAITAKFTRRGTYWFRWHFAGTSSYRKAATAATKVVVK